MSIIADLFRKHSHEYLRRFGFAMPSGHRKVIAAICSCRTLKAGVSHYHCEDCSKPHKVYRGCGNRHCPNCQHAKSMEWLNKRLRQQLPGPHFLITFTVPQTIRNFIRSNQTACYEALFKASAQALKDLALDKKHIGADLPGFFGVLQTWGGQLIFHPHIHYVVPGGALDRTTKMWKPSREDFFVPVGALSKLVRGKFRAAMEHAGLLDQIDAKVWRECWVVDSQAVEHNAEGVLKYLAPYVFRVAISDSRIIKVTERAVTFRYKDSRVGKTNVMTLEVIEFMRRFLQHVLPKGFQKVRYFGFMGSGCKIPHEEVAMMIELCLNFECRTPKAPPEMVSRFRCPDCGGRLILDAVHWPLEGRVFVKPGAT